MSVVDASVVVEYLAGQATAGEQEAIIDRVISAPALMAVEVTNVIRGLERARRLDGDQVADLRTMLAELHIDLYEDGALLDGAWRLRGGCTIYDALYVALAIELEVPFYTRDLRLARAVRGIVDVRCASA